MWKGMAKREVGRDYIEKWEGSFERWKGYT